MGNPNQTNPQRWQFDTHEFMGPDTMVEYWKYSHFILNIDQQIFLNEADLAENHLIQL